MEAGVSLTEAIRAAFGCGRQDLRTYSPLSLAFVGDCVYDLVVRTVVTERGSAAPSALHKRKSQVVRASAQAALIEALLPELTPEEAAVYKRGRNAHPHTSAKNASIGDYRKATGLEALCGFLYLTERTDRLLYLIRRGVELTGQSL